MERIPICPDLSRIPGEFHRLFSGCPVYDSSCSPDARVFYLDREGGLFLKSAPAGTLKQEEEMDAYFHALGLGPEVLAYRSEDRDWLLTRRVPGEDCLNPEYLADPRRLAETMALMLRDLHSRDASRCPVQNHTERYVQTAHENHRLGRFDTSLFPANWGCATEEEAWDIILCSGQLLSQDTLLHGDYCLPNILLDRWKPSGFIDVGRGGVGDRHIDLFWGIWSLNYNLKTDRFTDRFLDAYGREEIQEEMFRIVAAFEVFE